MNAHRTPNQDAANIRNSCTEQAAGRLWRQLMSPVPLIGTHLALAKGSRFVRIFFLVVVCGLILKLTQTLLWP